MDLDNSLTIKKFHRCDICLFYGTKSISLIINHVQRHRKIATNSQEAFNCSSELGKYKCIKCDYQTSLRVNLKRHICAHCKIPRTSQKVFICSSELDKYKCLKCDYQTPFKVNLKRHVCSSNQHNKFDFVEIYNCENCVFQTSSYLMLGKHVHYDCKNVINNDAQKLSENCRNNDESGESIDCFEKEIDKVDKNEIIKNDYYSGHCSYKTELKRNLRKHIFVYWKKHLVTERSDMLSKCNNDTYPIEEIRLFKCKSCSYECKQKTHLSIHILLKHTAPEKINWLKCEHCTFQCKLKASLKQHILLKHTASENVEWLKCKNCSYKCKQKGHLNQHILCKHTASENIKWFKCKNCSFQTKHKDSLNRHILFKHTAPEKLEWFKCDYCSFQTKHKCNLKRHILGKHVH